MRQNIYNFSHRNQGHSHQQLSEKESKLKMCKGHILEL